MSMIFNAINTPADEIGVATGLNTSAYKSWEKNGAEYQKTDILNPIEVTFRKDFTDFLGIHSALQYSNRSISQSIQSTRINSETSYIELAGMVKYEEAIRFLSLEISPIFFYRLKHVLIDARFGVSADLYINEWTNNFGGNPITLRSKETSPIVLSFVSGVGLGYIIKDKFKIGIRSSISRTITDIYKNQPEGADIFYLNFHNVICFSLLL